MVRGLFSGLAVGAVTAVTGLGVTSLVAPLPSDARSPNLVARATDHPAPIRLPAGLPRLGDRMVTFSDFEDKSDNYDKNLKSYDKSEAPVSIVAKTTPASADPIVSTAAPDAAPAAQRGSASTPPLVPAGSGFSTARVDEVPQVSAEDSVTLPASEDTPGADQSAQPVMDQPQLPQEITESAPRPTPSDSPMQIAGLDLPETLPDMPQRLAPVPVPPPGEAVAPELLPADTGERPAQMPQTVPPESLPEVVLLPDGTIVTPQAPDVVAPDPSFELGVQDSGDTPAMQQQDVPPADTTISDDALPRVLVLDGSTTGLRSAPDIPTDRLPRIGDPVTDQAQEVAPQVTQAPKGDSTPLQQYSMPFVAPQDAALFSVVLIDPGVVAGGLDGTTIRSLTVPVTVAIDPARADAKEVAQSYRDSGFEVAILASDLPAGAKPEDLAVALEAWRSVIPDAIAVVEPSPARIQNDRSLARALVELLEQEGLGLITQERGLNAASQLAENIDLPETKTWRVLDDGREGAPRIARELNRSAFEAKRNGSVVVMLSAWPDSVAGLMEWSSKADDEVKIAPASAILKRAMR
ncbi:hypothetical protein BFP70_04460 [Thioclava sp. SK-1]|uniref:divergent polysaccharide deacetylase family protein n=1 Tax=Thioclava sp. SK-1 TaxID=1889770 RepID=UPI000826901F|nr:divergent polysaccharide deacetylase family protein [Thioclava sp. SK-1]OCX66489.1 hypothetical protein BFP70_04460 [Thioclava sp. SK-1]